MRPSDIFRWPAFLFRVRLGPSDYAAHAPAYLDQGTVAHDVHGRLLWSAVRPTPCLSFSAVLPAFRCGVPGMIWLVLHPLSHTKDGTFREIEARIRASRES